MHDDDYDPDADLALLRGDIGSRLAVYVLVATGIGMLGSYVQALYFASDGVFRFWVHGKLAVIAAVGLAVLRTTRMRPEARWLYPAVAIAAFVESTAWVLVLVLHFRAFSVFAVAAAFESLGAVAFSYAVLAASGRAVAARERLAANGIDDPFA